MNTGVLWREKQTQRDNVFMVYASAFENAVVGLRNCLGWFTNTIMRVLHPSGAIR